MPLKNRRNYYRILHVQPEAPAEIIRASYRTLMSKLRIHPDLGGDTETAALVNQAYQVLMDPETRRKYDHALTKRGPLHVASRHPGQPGPNAAGASDQRRTVHAHSPTAHASACLFCGTGHKSGKPSLCTNCDSPLEVASPAMRVGGKELFGRRNAPRMSKNEDIRIFPCWPHHGVPAQLRDLSPTGLRFTTSYSPQPGQVLKINGDKFLAIAQVLHVQQLGGRASIHGIFLGVNFMAPSGAFVSVAI